LNYESVNIEEEFGDAPAKPVPTKWNDSFNVAMAPPISAKKPTERRSSVDARAAEKLAEEAKRVHYQSRTGSMASIAPSSLPPVQTASVAAPAPANTPIKVGTNTPTKVGETAAAKMARISFAQSEVKGAPDQYQQSRASVSIPEYNLASQGRRESVNSQAFNTPTSPKPQRESVSGTAAAGGASKLGFVLPESFGEFRYAKRNRAFRALRRFSKVVAKDTVIPVALVVCTDIIFLCTPGELPTDPLILLHQPSQRTGCKVESDADSKRFVLTMEGGERHLLECTTDKEALFWINSIQKMEGYSPSDNYTAP